jgi:hypothetical protein
LTDFQAIQAKADSAAAAFNRTLRNVYDLPWVIEKVVGLQHLRDIFDQFRKPAPGVALERADEVEATIQGMEQGCRERGLYEQFAELPRAERRRLKRLAGDI